MSSKKTVKTSETRNPSPFAMPFVSSAGGALQGGYDASQAFVNTQLPNVQSLAPTMQDRFESSRIPGLASGLAGSIYQQGQDFGQISTMVDGITPDYNFTAPNTSQITLGQDFLGSNIASAARQSQQMLSGINTSYTAPTGRMDELGGQALSLGDAFRQQSGAMGDKAAAIPGQFSFDPSAYTGQMGTLGTQIGSIPGQYAYSGAGAQALGQQSLGLQQRAAAMPGQYQFGTAPVTADTSGMQTVADAATALGSRTINPRTGGLETVGSAASALPGQFSLGDTRNVNVDTSGVDRIGAQAEALPGQFDLASTERVGSRSAPIYGAAAQAYGIPGQFDLGDTRDTAVDSRALDTLSGAAVRAGGQRVTPQTAGMSAWEQTARSLPGEYQFGADETDSRAVARDAMSASDAGSDRMSSLSRQIGSIPGQYRVSYDGPNDIIGGAAGQDYVNRVLGGEYLNSNPYIDEMARIARQNAFNDVSSAFGRSGMTGSTNFGSSLGRGVSEAETGLRYANYEGERGRMGDAANLDYNFAGLRTNTAANAAGQRMQAQQYNAGNALQAAGLQSQLAQSMSSNELQALGIRADIADAIANRTLQGQQYAAQLGLDSTALGSDIASRIAEMNLTADTANADRLLSGIGLAGDMQGQVMSERSAADIANADRSLVGQRAQADLALGASQLGGGLVRDAAGMDQAAAISDADRALAGRQAAADLGLGSARLAGDLAGQSMQTRAQTATSDADRAARGQEAQAQLALESLGISRDVAQAIMSGQLDADRVMADLGISALQVQQALAQAAAQLGLQADEGTADRTLAAQRAAADFGLGAGQLQADALGQGLAAERLGMDIAGQGAQTALAASGQQADLLGQMADTQLGYTRAGADTALSAAELQQRAMESGQRSQLDALGTAAGLAGDSARLQSQAAQDSIANTLQRAGLSIEAASDARNQELALLAQRVDLAELQSGFEQARLAAEQSGDAAMMDKARLLGSILNDRIGAQIGTSQAAAGLETADLPLMQAYLEAIQSGATLPMLPAATYAGGIGNLMGGYVDAQGKQVQSGGGLGSILGPLLSIGASFIPGAPKK